MAGSGHDLPRVVGVVTPSRCGACRGANRGWERLDRGCRLAQMERHARHHDVRSEEQRALDEERMLVVEQVLPDPARHELRQDHGDVAVRVRRPDGIDIVE